jgi:hypothetical protein
MVHYLWQLNGKRNEDVTLPPCCFSTSKRIALTEYEYVSQICLTLNFKCKISDIGTSVCAIIDRQLEVKMVGSAYSGMLFIPSLMRIIHFVQKSLISHNCYSSPSTIRMLKSKRMRWAGQ